MFLRWALFIKRLRGLTFITVQSLRGVIIGPLLLDMYFVFAHRKVMGSFGGDTHGGVHFGVVVDEKLDGEELLWMCFDQELRM